jgi:hypothetical protein
MTDVWLTEKSGNGWDTVFGIFSTPEKAIEICQDSANEYFGAAKPVPLKWLVTKDGGYRSASYVHPTGGHYLFQVTKFTVDEVEGLE